MQKIGEICHLQVQTASLKAGDRLNRTYDPAPLRSVPILYLEPAGASAPAVDGAWVDVHNASHPASKNRDGINALSFNFAGHYAQMQERFGPHLAPGIAGENILIDAPDLFTLSDLAGALAIQPAAGQLLL
ncbi:MAG TPA: hypothetical protein PKE45_22660, partial [Caldilineaceae bacterium]|nr:hypothetical protein [Caldilineaceae bacterium]